MSSSDNAVSQNLLGNRATSPPVAQRSSKSFVSQVKDTLFSFIKKAKGEGDSVSQKQRRIESFTERVATFSVSKWMGKPLALSPPLFAQYGWQCIGVDTVKCCSCAAVMCIKLPWPDAGNYRQQCFNYRQRVITSHMKICSWPSYPCPDSFIAPFDRGGVSTSEIVTQFKKRRENLLKLRTKLPNLDPDIKSLLNLAENDLESLYQEQSENNESHSSGDTLQAGFSAEVTAAILAMCGWDTAHNDSSKSPTIFCASSGRVVYLRNFFRLGNECESCETDDTSSQVATLLSNSSNLKRRLSNTIDESSDSPIKKLKTSDGGSTESPSRLTIIKQNFHPLEQHSPWTFWITVLKPISREEFESDAVKKGESPTDKDQNDDLYHFIINPTRKDAKPGWQVVRDSVLGNGNAQDDIQEVAVAGSLIEGSSPARVQTDSAKKISPKSPVIHVRKLLREWSHHK